ncbi:MAG: phosphoglycerate mutase family protein [Mariprofundaceae bacterium]|nr:phosphoglycerate mutase family protein [Mariprofundaceae bacterium]
MIYRYLLAVSLLLLPTLLSAEEKPTTATTTIKEKSKAFHGMELYFVRHARTLANELNRHTEDLGRTLSKKGKVQVKELTAQLNTLQFDHIISSPTVRTRKTLYPYLKARLENPDTYMDFKKAELWTDLMECCWQKDKTLGLTPKDQVKTYQVFIDKKYHPYFHFPSGDYAIHRNTKTYADGIAQMDRVIKLLKIRFSNSDKKILIVSHYLFLNQMIKRMANIETEHKISSRNAQITKLVEQADGRFKMVIFNNAPMHGLDYPEYYEKYQRQREGAYQYQKNLEKKKAEAELKK